MLKQNRWIILILTLAIGSIATIVMADAAPDWMFSSENPGSIAQIAQPETIGDTQDENGFTGVYQTPPHQDNSSSASNPLDISPTETDDNREQQPDDDGYTGSTLEREQNIVDSSADINTDIATQPDWNTFHTESQLDDNVNGESHAPAEPEWSTLFHYVHVAGSTLRPRDSSVEWDVLESGGCLYNNGGNTSEIFNIHLDIPNGSLIEYLRIYYYDTSSSDSIAWVTLYDDAGGYDDVVSAASDGNAGYGTMLSSQVAHVVDTDTDSYLLNWRPIASGSTMALCGLRVAYRLPD